MSWSFFGTVIVFTGSCFIFSYIGFPFFSFLSVLVEGIGDRIGVIKHKRKVFVFLTSEKKAQAWEELLKDQRHIAFKTPVAYMLIFADLKRFFSAVHTLRWL